MSTRFVKLTVAIFCLLLISSVVLVYRRVKDAGAMPQVIKTKTGIEMVAIPGGWFEMGSGKGAPDELPVHRVRISPFWMDRYEVPQEEFKKYQISDPSHFKSPKHPLEQMNWTDAATYCNERSIAEGFEPCYDEQTWGCDFRADGYRLPTEAEWEYACRAGTSTEYSFGDDEQKLRSYAWFADNSSQKTHPIGHKKPNPWGLHDMYGNVAEWCNDFYSEDYYGQSPEKDPKGPYAGREKVLRGGAWNSSADICRSAYRASDPSINDTCLASDAIGFRCVRSAALPEIQNVTGEVGTELDTSTGYGEQQKKSTTGFVYHDIFLQHTTTPGHPENPQRLVAIVDRLKTKGLYSQLIHISPSPAASEWIATVHRPEYLDRASRSCQGDIGYLDSADVPISRRSYEAALMAAGGVLSAIDAIMEKRIKNAFCAVRPPGHHALWHKAMGFCIFNNVAVGTRYIQEKYSLQKVLIVDWDVHHGNGTQATFYDDPTVLYFGVHQYPFYPGTGSESERGSGAGLNYNINVPLPAGSGDDVYLRVFEQRLKPAAYSFSPDFILISAGFDAHRDDLLGHMRVTEEGFAQLTQIVKTIAEECCEGRLVSVLEGGYDLEGLAASVEAHIRVLMK